MTTRGRPFFDYCESLQGKNHVGYLGALSSIFTSFEDARKRYDAGEFVHSKDHRVSGGGELDSSFYDESFIPEDYAKLAYADKFQFVKYLYDAKRHEHPILFFIKK